MSSSFTKSASYPAWFNKLFPIIFFLGGIMLLTVGSKEAYYGYSSTNWPKTIGLITESRIAHTGNGQKGSKPVIWYSYAVEGQYYSSERILFGNPSFRTINKSGLRRTNEWLEKYPESSEANVYYNPTDPGQSTLNTGLQLTALFAPVLGILFFVMSIFMIRSFKK